MYNGHSLFDHIDSLAKQMVNCGYRSIKSIYRRYRWSSSQSQGLFRCTKTPIYQRIRMLQIRTKRLKWNCEWRTIKLLPWSCHKQCQRCWSRFRQLGSLWSLIQTGIAVIPCAVFWRLVETWLTFKFCALRTLRVSVWFFTVSRINGNKYLSTEKSWLVYLKWFQDLWLPEENVIYKTESGDKGIRL